MRLYRIASVLGGSSAPRRSASLAPYRWPSKANAIPSAVESGSRSRGAGGAGGLVAGNRVLVAGSARFRGWLSAKAEAAPSSRVTRGSEEVFGNYLLKNVIFFEHTYTVTFPRVKMREDGLMRQVIDLQARAGMSQPEKMDDQMFHFDPRLWKVKEYVDRHYRESLDLRSVAEVAGLEGKDFSEFFHQKTGVPFHEWLSWVRVNRAVELMAFGDRPLTEQSLTEIALEVGFRDLNTFERAVENCTGKTLPGVKNGLHIAIRT